MCLRGALTSATRRLSPTWHQVDGLDGGQLAVAQRLGLGRQRRRQCLDRGVLRGPGGPICWGGSSACRVTLPCCHGPFVRHADGANLHRITVSHPWPAGSIQQGWRRSGFLCKDGWRRIGQNRTQGEGACSDAEQMHGWEASFASFTVYKQINTTISTGSGARRAPRRTLPRRRWSR